MVQQWAWTWVERKTPRIPPDPTPFLKWLPCLRAHSLWKQERTARPWDFGARGATAWGSQAHRRPCVSGGAQDAGGPALCPAGARDGVAGAVVLLLSAAPSSSRGWNRPSGQSVSCAEVFSGEENSS